MRKVDMRSFSMRRVFLHCKIFAKVSKFVNHMKEVGNSIHTFNQHFQNANKASIFQVRSMESLSFEEIQTMERIT